MNFEMDAVELTQEECIERIVGYLRSTAIDPLATIPLNRSLLEAGILDSFGIVELFTFVEAEFELAIPDEDITSQKMGSIRKMAAYIVERKAA